MSSLMFVVVRCSVRVFLVVRSLRLDCCCVSFVVVCTSLFVGNLSLFACSFLFGVVCWLVFVVCWELLIVLGYLSLWIAVGC